MKTKLLKLVRREAKTVIFDVDNGNAMYGYELSSKIRAIIEHYNVGEAVYERRRLRRDHIISRIKDLRSNWLFRLIWVLKNRLK